MSAPESTWVIRRTWSWPIMPVPMTPTLRVMAVLLSRWRDGSVGPAPDGAEAAPDVVARGAGADGEWDVGRHGVEVLLDHGVDLPVEPAEPVEERRHVGFAVRRLAHHA